MQIAAETTKSKLLSSATLSEFSVTAWESQASQYRAIRCNGAVVSIESSEISVAATEVFLAVDGVQGTASAKLQLQVIDDGLSEPLDLGCQTGRSLNWGQFIGPIG